MNLQVLRVLALAWVPLLGVLVATAAVVDVEVGWPVTGTILILGVGVVALVIIAWVRQRPIAPDDDDTYRTTTLIKLALVEGIGLVGFVLAIAVGPWWLAAVGAALSLIGLWVSRPSEADRERHQLLYLV